MKFFSPSTIPRSVRKLAALAVLLGVVAPAVADDLYPPDWRGNPGTTFQHWEFSEIWPLEWVPEIDENPYGEPWIDTPFGMEQWLDEWHGRAGILYAPNTELYIHLPNVPEPNDWKIVYIQITWWHTDSGFMPPQFVMTDPPGELVSEEFYGLEENWHHSVFEIWIPGNPDFETVTLWTDHYIDQIVVDTYCFSESGPSGKYETKLIPDTPEAYERFGFSVAVDKDSVAEDFALVGAPGVASGEGEAYVFERSLGGPDNWGLHGVLNPSILEDGDEFGWSVAIDGYTAVVGAPYRNGTTTNEGSVFVFEWNGTAWILVQEVVPAIRQTDERFGWSVDIIDACIIVGAPYYDDPSAGIDAGRAVVFRGPSTWVEIDVLQPEPPDAPGAFDEFGYDVAISSDGDGNEYAIIGAPGDDGMASDAGAAYIFYAHEHGTDNWGQREKLTAGGAAHEFAAFGAAVDIDYPWAVVGAWGDDDVGTNSGAAYIFQEASTYSWPLDARITAGTHAWSQASFGCSVSLDMPHLLVGADYDQFNGAAYWFERDEGAWTKRLRIFASNGANHDNFGCDVALDYEYALVGAWGNDDNGMDAGMAYVYDLTYMQLVWDNYPNGPNAGYMSSQLDTVYPFDSQTADDFWFDDPVAVRAVEWNGGFWGGDPVPVPEWNIMFYADAGGKPTGGPTDPTGTALAHYVLPAADVTVMSEDDGSWTYFAFLPSDFVVAEDQVRWIAIQAVFPYPPQWGISVAAGSLQGSEIMFGFPLLGYDYWVTGTDAFGDPRDMAFRLYGSVTSPPCPADINGDGKVDVLDLLMVLAAWGMTGEIPEDINGDGTVDVLDLLELLAAWGPCP